MKRLRDCVLQILVCVALSLPFVALSEIFLFYLVKDFVSSVSLTGKHFCFLPGSIILPLFQLVETIQCEVLNGFCLDCIIAQLNMGLQDYNAVLACPTVMLDILKSCILTLALPILNSQTI